MYGVDKLVCVFVGQLARKGIEYLSDLHVDILTGLLFSNFVDTEHFRSSLINEYYGPNAYFTL